MSNIASFNFLLPTEMRDKRKAKFESKFVILIVCYVTLVSKKINVFVYRPMLHTLYLHCILLHIVYVKLVRFFLCCCFLNLVNTDFHKNQEAQQSPRAPRDDGCLRGNISNCLVRRAYSL